MKTCETIADKLQNCAALSAASTRPDPRRPGFFEIEGQSAVFYVFKYPTGAKVLLLGVWDRDPVAEFVACAGSAA